MNLQVGGPRFLTEQSYTSILWDAAVLEIGRNSENTK